MPRKLESERRFSAIGLVVNVHTRRGGTSARGGTSVHVSVEGDVDLAGATVLSSVAATLFAAAPAHVHVDLAAVTFAGSALPNFLSRLHADLPHAELLVCRPTSLTRRVLQATGLSEIARTCPHSVEPALEHAVPQR